MKGNLSCGNRGENVASGTGEFGVITFCRGGQHGRSDGNDDVTSNNGECLEFVKLLLVAPGDRFSIKGLVNFHVERAWGRSISILEPKGGALGESKRGAMMRWNSENCKHCTFDM